MNTLRPLAELEREQLVRRAEIAPELEFVFKHALVQEAAYASLLKSSRITLHLQIAEALERLSPHRRDGLAAVLAGHYDKAGREDKVLEYALQAGQAAGAVHAHAEAAGHFDRALLAAGRLDPLTAEEAGLARRAFVSRGAMLEALNRFGDAAQNYTDMIAFASRHGDAESEAEATNLLVTVRILREGAGDAARQAAEAALALAERSGSAVLVGRALWNLGLYYRFLDPARAVGYLDRVQELARGDPSGTGSLRELAAIALTDSVIAFFASGQNRRAVASARQAVEEYQALGHTNLLANAHGSLAFALHLAGRLSEARAAAQRAIDLSARIFSPWGTFYGAWQIGIMDVEQGVFEPYLADPAPIIALAQPTNFDVFLGAAHFVVARAWLSLGRPEKALAHAEAGDRLHAATGLPTFEVMGAGIHALALLKAGRVEEARRAFRRLWAMLPDGQGPVNRIEGLCYALDGIVESFIAERQFERGIAFCDGFLAHLESEDMDGFAASTRRWRGRLLLEAGDAERALTDFDRAEPWMRRERADALLWPMHVDQARAFDRRGDAARAAEARSKAIALIRDIAGRFSDPALRAQFLAWERVVDGRAGDNGPQP